MKRTELLLVGLIAVIYFSGCQRDMICPAYHSYFILDIDETRNTFSLFGADSLPKQVWGLDQKKYGIAKNIPDWKKRSDMRIISMNSIYKQIEDPFAQFSGALAESDSTIVIDTAAVLAANRPDKDFQNIDQMIYLYHFGQYLPARNRNDWEEIKDDLVEEDEPLIQDEEEEEPKKKRGLFGIFRKNKKSGPDDEAEEEDGSDQ
jgi:hypothetical protein